MGRSFRVLTLLVTTAAVLAVACTPAPPAKQAVKLQLPWVAQTQFAGYYVAKDKGFYAAENLEVEIVPGGPDVNPIQQVANGAADFVPLSVAGLYIARDKGIPFRAFAQM